MNAIRMAVVLALALAPIARAHASPHEGAGGAEQEHGTKAHERGAKAQEQGAKKAGETAAQRDQPGMLPDKTERDPAQARASAHTVVGTVEKVEGDALTLRSSKLSDPYEVKLGKDTEVLHAGQSIAREEIAEGDQVRATFVGDKESGGDATEVVVIRKGEGKAVKGTERTTAGERQQKEAPPSQPSRSQ